MEGWTALCDTWVPILSGAVTWLSSLYAKHPAAPALPLVELCLPHCFSGLFTFHRTAHPTDQSLIISSSIQISLYISVISLFEMSSLDVELAKENFVGV